MTPRSETPKDEGPWAWQAREAAARAGQIGINAYAIYCALTHFQSAAATDHKRRFAASYEQISEHVGCAKNTVARVLPELQKAGLIRIFSGANGSFRATRNAFFLTSISQPPQGHGTPSQGQHVKPSQGCFNKNKEQLDRAASSGSGSNKEKNEEAHTRLPSGGSGGSLKKPAGYLRDLTPEEAKQAREMAERTKNL